MSTDNSDLIADFIAESKEGLAGIEGDLLTIEADGANASVDLINKVFRAIHSMKGPPASLDSRRSVLLPTLPRMSFRSSEARNLSPTPQISSRYSVRSID